MAIGSPGPQAIIEKHRKDRGTANWEMERLALMVPEAVVMALECADYVHRYEGNGAEGQELSVQMRELIATVMLASKGEDKFATAHVRRLHRYGVTNDVILEAFLAAVPVLGWSNMLHAVRAIEAAKEPSAHDAGLPPADEPETLADFPELHLGQDRSEAQREDTGLGATPEWQYIAQIDPGLAQRVVRLYDMVYSDGGAELPRSHLPPAARELVAIAAFCARGLPDLAAQHIKRAIRAGASPRQVLEAISAVLPMTGLTSIQIGAQAMMKAGIAP
ncbi:MAG: carboxymuconolactone decarboxylase family protein [Chloroflexi bacterium]|nr:carboxymuconolactone decarboxylase family protein [Chloroflexota bacterium]